MHSKLRIARSNQIFSQIYYIYLLNKKEKKKKNNWILLKIEHVYMKQYNCMMDRKIIALIYALFMMQKTKATNKEDLVQ